MLTILPVNRKTPIKVGSMRDTGNYMKHTFIVLLLYRNLIQQWKHIYVSEKLVISNYHSCKRTCGMNEMNK